MFHQSLWSAQAGTQNCGAPPGVLSSSFSGPSWRANKLMCGEFAHRQLSTLMKIGANPCIFIRGGDATNHVGSVNKVIWSAVSPEMGD
jgi:hypothetical protein